MKPTLFASCFLLACGNSTSPGDGDAQPGDASITDAQSSADVHVFEASVLDGGGPCGVRAGERGLTSRTITMPTTPNQRTYLVYVPASLDPQTPVPIVLVHHGYLMSGQAMHDITQFTDLADTEGFAVVFPDGEGGPNSLEAPWNVSTGNCYPGDTESATGDDFAFDEAMRADVEQDQCIDEKHTFVTGFSMGGFFSHHSGCMHSDFARAVAPHSGGTHPFTSCDAAHVPVIVFHGDADIIISESCDDAAVQQWITKNGCSTTADIVNVTGGVCSYFQNCPADGQVAYCKFSGLGHAWAGGAADAGVFSGPGYASATSLEWDFFKKYAW